MAGVRVVLNDVEIHLLRRNATEAERNTCGGRGLFLENPYLRFLFTSSESVEMFNSNFRDFDEDPFFS